MRRRLALWLAWMGIGMTITTLSLAQQAREHVLDDFADVSTWSVVATDDVKASMRSVPGADGGRALCLDFDFGRVSGFVALRRSLPIDFPARYELAFDVRGEAPSSALQLKFADASGDNVWWMQRRGFRPPAAWQRLRVKQRQLEFAWGPTSDRVLRHTDSIEFVIASGSGIGAGGRGSVCVGGLVLRELPALPATAPAPVVHASSSRAGHAAGAALVVSGATGAQSVTGVTGAPSVTDATGAPSVRDATGAPSVRDATGAPSAPARPASAAEAAAPADWQPAPGDARPTLAIDFGTPREFTSLIVHARSGAAPQRYTIEASDDGVRWRVLQRVEHARGARQAHWLGETEARHLRLVFERQRSPLVLRGIEPGDALSADAFFTLLARRSARGSYPRAYAGEQSYWTVFGVEGARVASLLSEDGAVEPVPGVGALEPLLIVDGRVLAWSDMQIDHSLVDDELPMPRVHWRSADGSLALDIEAFGDGRPQAAQALASFRLHNRSTQTREVTLVLAWRPFQANPPTQFLMHPGGASVIRELAWDGAALQVAGLDANLRVSPLTPPDSVRIEPMAAGPVAEWVAQPAGRRAASGPDAKALTVPQRLVDPAGYPSAALTYRMALKAGEARSVAVALPVEGTPAVVRAADVARREQAVAQRWRERLGGVRLSGGPQVREVAHTLRASLGQILVNRSAAALQPGARAYARSWIRDGAMTSSALLRMGRADVARDFLRWYAPFQFSNGKVPCCATERGADPVPENDSHGELAFAAYDLWHYTRDLGTAREMWPHVLAAIGYMEGLRQSERTERNRHGERAGYYGMMPPSISHEGYSDKAAYSYWDDHWALIGYRSAVELAQALGLADEAKRIGAQRDEFERDLLASIDATARRYSLDVLSGAADRGDVDPTSSTIALTPGGLLGTLPEALVRRTFDHYWREFERRRADEHAGVRHGDGAYTPYEWRNVGSFVRLGERDRALAALQYFFADRRPAGWRQWAEVVLRNPREPRFLGDMPHGWVASDHIRSVLDLFAYEHEGDHSMVLAAGVPLAWWLGDGLQIEGLQTPYGALAWRGRATRAGSRTTVEFDVQALREMPPGGLLLRGPWPAAAQASIDGRPWHGPADAIRLPATPARVRVEFDADKR